MTLTLQVLSIVVLLALASGALAILARRLSSGGPRGRPAYLGPDVTEVEILTQQLLADAREGRGLPPLTPDDELVELARHHAHWMSVTGRCTERDDQERDVAARKRDLFGPGPGEVVQAQWCLDVHSADPGAESRRLADAADSHALDLATARLWGFGVASGSGRLWACLVVGRPTDD
jgi:hypothetical protein